MKLTFSLTGFRDANAGPSSRSAPFPLDHHSSGWMPSPKNRKANRFGGEFSVRSDAAARIESCHGNATVAPRPFNTTRRDNNGELMDFSGEIESSAKTV